MSFKFLDPALKFFTYIYTPVLIFTFEESYYELESILNAIWKPLS